MQNVSKRVLVAEDNLALAHVLQFNLQRSGFDVTVAHNGGEAWDFVQREKFDVIVTDHEMPLMTGVELCAGLRVAAIMPKPYSAVELLNTVEKLLAEEALRSP